MNIYYLTHVIIIALVKQCQEQLKFTQPSVALERRTICCIHFAWLRP